MKKILLGPGCGYWDSWAFVTCFTELLLHGGDISVLRYPCEPDCAAISIYRWGIKTDKSQGPDFQLHLFMEMKGFLETQLKHA